MVGCWPRMDCGSSAKPITMTPKPSVGTSLRCWRKLQQIIETSRNLHIFVICFTMLMFTHVQIWAFGNTAVSDVKKIKHNIEEENRWKNTVCRFDGEISKEEFYVMVKRGGKGIRHITSLYAEGTYVLRNAFPRLTARRKNYGLFRKDGRKGRCQKSWDCSHVWCGQSHGKHTLGWWQKTRHPYPQNVG